MIIDCISDLHGFYPELEGGDLTLGIFCTKCGAQFEIGKQGAAMAVLMQDSFLNYLRWVQSSSCPACREEEKD